MINDDLKAIKKAMEWVERCSPDGRRYVLSLVSNRCAADADAELARLQAEDDARGAGA